MRRTPWAIAALALALACSKKPEGGGATGATTDGPIKVGEVGSMTGTEATFGISSDRGIQMRVKEVNGAGGIKNDEGYGIAVDKSGNAFVTVVITANTHHHIQNRLSRDSANGRAADMLDTEHKLADRIQDILTFNLEQTMPFFVVRSQCNCSAS